MGVSTYSFFFFFFQAEDGIRDYKVTGVQTCALPISTVRPSDRFDRQTDFRPIAPLLHGLDDLRVGHVELTDVAQGLAHDRALRGELGVVGEMLELAAAAPIPPVMGAGRRHPRAAGRPGDGGGSHHLRQLAAREGLVQPDAVPEPHPLPGRGARHEHGAPVREPAHAVPARSRYVVSTSPRLKSGSSITRRWNAWDEGIPTITSSRRARRIRSSATVRVSPHTMSFAMSGS